MQNEVIQMKWTFEIATVLLFLAILGSITLEGWH